MRGRKPTPPQVAALKSGVAPVAVDPEVPDCPAWLDDDARAEWARVAPELGRYGLLSRVDMAALACYCQALSTLQRCAAQIKADGLIVPGSRGQSRIHPAAQQADLCMRQIRAFCSEFGLSPVSRMRLSVPDRNPEREAFDEF